MTWSTRVQGIGSRGRQGGGGTTRAPLTGLVFAVTVKPSSFSIHLRRKLSSKVAPSSHRAPAERPRVRPQDAFAVQALSGRVGGVSGGAAHRTDRSSRSTLSSMRATMAESCFLTTHADDGVLDSVQPSHLPSPRPPVLSTAERGAASGWRVSLPGGRRGEERAGRGRGRQRLQPARRAPAGGEHGSSRRAQIARPSTCAIPARSEACPPTAPARGLSSRLPALAAAQRQPHPPRTNWPRRWRGRRSVGPEPATEGRESRGGGGEGRGEYPRRYPPPHAEGYGRPCSHCSTWDLILGPQTQHTPVTKPQRCASSRSPRSRACPSRQSGQGSGVRG